MRIEMMRQILTVTVLAASALVSGCATMTGAPSPLAFASTGSSNDIYLTALHGGLISKAKGIDISSSERRLALAAEYKALEAAPSGQAVIWDGDGVKGQVVASPPYQVGSQNCRQYTHTVTEDGTSVAERGAACRNSDGTWTPLI